MRFGAFGRKLRRAADWRGNASPVSRIQVLLKFHSRFLYKLQVLNYWCPTEELERAKGTLLQSGYPQWPLRARWCDHKKTRRVMKTKFAVMFRSDAYQRRIIFTARNRTPTLAEFARFVEKHEGELPRQPLKDPLIVDLGRLPPTRESTMPPAQFA